MAALTIFVLLIVLPSGAISVLGQQRGCRQTWLYALAAYAIGPLALVLFLWRESFKRCPVCHAECSWDALACRTCLAPFPMTPVEEARVDDSPREAQKEDHMSQSVGGSDPTALAVVLAPLQGQEQLPTSLPLPAEMTELVRDQAGGQPMQVTINVTQIAPTVGPAAECGGLVRG